MSPEKLTGPDLLRKLASGATVRPGGGVDGAEAIDFGDLLERARRGELRSTDPVTVEPSLGLELSEEEMALLSVAADRAEAAGSRRAMVMLGERALVLDVEMRRITAEAGIDDGDVLTQVDAVLRADAEPSRSEDGVLPAPVAERMSASLLRVLEARERGGDE